MVILHIYIGTFLNSLVRLLRCQDRFVNFLVKIWKKLLIKMFEDVTKEELLKWAYEEYQKSGVCSEDMRIAFVDGYLAGILKFKELLKTHNAKIVPREESYLDIPITVVFDCEIEK
jgi:hypothetical protein